MQIDHIEQFNPAFTSVKNNLKNSSSKLCVILDIMIHNLELLLSLIKSKINSVHSIGISIFLNNLDTANTCIKFSNRSIANIKTNKFASKNKRKIKIFKKNTYIVMNLLNYNTKIIKN